MNKNQLLECKYKLKFGGTLTPEELTDIIQTTENFFTTEEKLIEKIVNLLECKYNLEAELNVLKRTFILDRD
jgi:hypothetical protein